MTGHKGKLNLCCITGEGGHRVGKRIPVELGVIRFNSLKAATDYFGGVLHGYRPGDHVSPAHQSEILALLNRHPDHIAKIGVGVQRIEVIEADFATQCFAVRRVDGSFEDFSYHTCISEGRY
ncbi:MAG: DUF3223 domain-containing protein [Cytophagaceae bacterium]|nr:MAG: DUF3223 domain-containing protein [Cytophagaceae bacterium]